jgi:hypothetical protein
MSTFGSESSANHGGRSSNGRPYVSPKYPSSTNARCLTNPSRFLVLRVGLSRSRPRRDWYVRARRRPFVGQHVTLDAVGTMMTGFADR